MKFSIVRIDKKRVLHLSVKTAEWFFERIKTDTKSEDIGGLRRYIAMYGNGEGYEQRTPVARIYPSVELVKRENGNLQIAAFNGLVWLHVADLLKKDERVVAVVGDGALGNGITFEALNNLRSTCRGLILIANDNKMSIARSTGAIARILNRIILRRSRLLSKERIAHDKAETRIDERTRLAVELHDSVAQMLTGISSSEEAVSKYILCCDKLGDHRRLNK